MQRGAAGRPGLTKASEETGRDCLYPGARRGLGPSGLAVSQDALVSQGDGLTASLLEGGWSVASSGVPSDLWTQMESGSTFPLPSIIHAPPFSTSWFILDTLRIFLSAMSCAENLQNFHLFNSHYMLRRSYYTC